MSWRPSLLRHVVSGSRSTLGPARFIGGARFTSQFSPTLPSAGSFDMKEMLGKALDIKGTLPEIKSPGEIWADKSNNLKLPPPPDTWTGRRVVVKNGDLHGAFQLLNQRLRQNNVAREIALTVRHEKKGDKRARLRSERWRKRFADAVRKKVQLVSMIRRRGG